MHPSSSILRILQRVESYVATNLSLSYLEAARIIEEKFQKLLGFLSMKLATMSRCVTQFITHSFWSLVFQSNPFAVQLIYFMAISFAGFLALKSLSPHGKPVPRDFDLMFTSVSTATVSSMSTIEMEDLSDQQLWVLILLMLLGGEVFTSMVGLHLNNAKANKEELSQRSLSSIRREIEVSISANNIDQIDMECGQSEAVISHNQAQQSTRHSSRTILAHIVTGYFLASVVCSSVVIIIYFWLNSDARQVLQSKEIKICTFAIFTEVSSFANCGFTPLNDNMAIFRKNPGFLLLVIPQILAGNTLFTPLLRLSIWALGRFSRREEYTYILQYPGETGYTFMQQQKNAINLVLTAVGITLLQMMLLCYFGWDSKPLEGLNWFQKLVCMLFQSVNTRHAGEAVIDISNLSPAILVLFALFMYHPSDGSSLPNSADDLTLTEKGEDKNSGTLWKNFIISKPICLVTSIILACITERKSMSLDPLNFNIFSIIFEAVSAYGNVGYSLGYSCERLLKPDATCKAVSYGFVGKWTDEGKLIIILVMFLGRFKRLSLKARKP